MNQKDEMLEEYDLSDGVNIVKLDSDIIKFSSDAKLVKES